MKMSFLCFSAVKFFGAIFINKLDIRLFGYSISERARAPILCEKRTVEYESIADGLRRFVKNIMSGCSQGKDTSKLA